MIAAVALALATAAARPDTIEFLPLTGTTLGDCTAGVGDTVPCRMRRQFDDAALRSHLASRSSTVWRDGDQLVFAARTPMGDVSLGGSIILPLSHLPGTDLWVLAVRIPGLDRAMLRYDFHNVEPRGEGEWRGPVAGPRPPRSNRLQGRIRHDTIASAALAMRRALVSYLPPDWLAQREKRVIYVADGQAVAELAPILDTLIAMHRVSPVALVGIESPPMMVAGPMARTLEYVYGATRDSSRFLAHERFFLDEVIPWSVRELAVDTAGTQMAVMGFSNGAAFALAMAVRHPARFVAAIAMSPAGKLPKLNGGTLPRIYLSAGSLEPGVLRNANAIEASWQRAGGSTRLDCLVSGHEDSVFSNQLPRRTRMALSTVKPLSVLVVDDEPVARDRMHRLVSAAGDRVRAVADGREAVDAIETEMPDLVFLDVQMPGLDGFGVVRRIGVDAMPLTVFVTAHEEFAVKAFETQAIDYLVKPYDDARFLAALERARRQLVAEDLSEIGARMQALLQWSAGTVGTATSGGPETSRLDQLVVKERGTSRLIRAAMIEWIEADGIYARIHIGGQQHLIRIAMHELEARLDPNRFARIHRSAIVNVQFVREFVGTDTGEFEVVLHSGTRIRMSRSRKRAFERRLGQSL